MSSRNLLLSSVTTDRAIIAGTGYVPGDLATSINLADDDCPAVYVALERAANADTLTDTLIWIDAAIRLLTPGATL